MFKVGDKVIIKDLKKYHGDCQDVVGVGDVKFISNNKAVVFVKYPYSKNTSRIINYDNIELAKKTCNKCGQKKLYSEFYKDHGKCKECCKKIRDAKKVHLCNTCVKEYPVCDGDIIEFGNGRGNDNIIKCNGYKIQKSDYLLIAPSLFLITALVLYILEVVK